MTYRKMSVVALVALSCASVATAQLSPEGGPIQINADRLDVFQQEDRAIYLGSVAASQSTARLNTDKLTIHFKNDAEGREGGISGGFASPETMIAEGRVVYETPDMRAEGDKGVYDAKTDTVLLTGNVILRRDGDIANGDCLTLEISAGRSTLGCRDENTDRIESVFNFEDRQDEEN